MADLALLAEAPFPQSDELLLRQLSDQILLLLDYSFGETLLLLLQPVQFLLLPEFPP